MRILIVLTYFRPHYSGLSIHAEREARSLAQLGHQVTVLTSRFDPSLPLREVVDGVEIIRPWVWFHISKGVIMPSMLLWAWKLAHRADVIHLHVPQLDAAPISLIGRLLGKPIVLTYHCDLLLPSGFVHWLANQVSNVANHITARLSHIIVHNTRDYAEHSPFLRHYLPRLYPILPPVEVSSVTEEDRQTFRLKYGIQPDERIIGMAARLATEKGVEYLVEALPKVLERFPKARVLFVGPYQNVVGEEQYAQRLAPLIQSVGAHWSFLGILSPVEMAAFFDLCEVTVLTSINSTESYGLVQVEAMTCGTPVVASDLPGVRVPVRDTRKGCIVPRKNAQALANALIEVLENPSAYQGDASTFIQQSTPLSAAREYEKAFELAQIKAGAKGFPPRKFPSKKRS